MHKTVNPKTHGILDYVIVALLLLAPSLFNFGGVAASIVYLLGIVHFAMSLLTRFPLGLAKVIPFPVHGLIEGGAGIFLVVAPWLFGFSEMRNATWFFVASGASVGILFALTNYRAVPADTQPLTHRRRVTA